jgi:hypothetical protein
MFSFAEKTMKGKNVSALWRICVQSQKTACFGRKEVPFPKENYYYSCKVMYFTSSMPLHAHIQQNLSG